MRHRITQFAWFGIALALFVSRPSAAGDSRIVDAAEHRAMATLRALLQQGVDVNAHQPDGATALHWAAHWDDMTMASELLDAGTNPDAVSDYGATPLLLAAGNGSAEMIAALLQAGANANAALPTGQTVLMTAARTGDAEAVRLLLGAGADVNATQVSRRQTPLMWAIAQRHEDVARLLVEHGADVSGRTASGFTPLLFSARNGDTTIARLLLAKGIDLNEFSDDGATPLLTATARGHVDFALFLLEQGAKPEGNLAVAGYTPLHWAVTTFETTSITYAGITPPGEWAAMAGIPDRKAKLTLIRALLAHGADVNARTTQPLLNQAPHISAWTSSPQTGFTPFLAAAASGDAEVMRLLVAHGADPLVETPNDETAVILATASDKDVSLRLTEAKRLEVVRLAFELGVDLDAADTPRGHRAMHLAARGGFHDIIAFLVQHGADPNAKTNPISQRGYGDSVRLMEAQTPLGLVEGTFYGPNHHQRPDTAQFLRGLGARSEGAAAPDLQDDVIADASQID